MEDKSPTTKYERRLAALKQEATSWKPHWQQLAEYLLPRKGRFLDEDQPNEGDRRNKSIIDGTATRALRTLGAGMQGGLTSPARPWFRLALQDKDLMDFGPVKQWLHIVRERMLNVFAQSNFYTSVHSLYQELAGFGTGALFVAADPRTVIRCRVFTIGEYFLALDSSYRADTLYRVVWMTVAQLVEKFGRDSVTDTTRNLYDRGEYDKWVEVVHVIEPRHDRDPGSKDNKNLPWKSVYYERGKQGEEYRKNPVLRESGFTRFPVMAPRWDVTGAEIYGKCPGMDALGDIKMLQRMQEKGLKALDKVVDPPMGAPSTLKTQKKSTVAGGITYFDTQGQQNGLAPLYQINPDLKSLEYKIERVQEAIRQNFFADMFLMIAGSNKDMTATEVAERHEEKLLMLGPVLERLQAELLDPLVDRVFDVMLESDLIPEPPRELQGAPLQVEYISLLAQAQKMVGTTAVEQTAAFVGNLTGVYPEVKDKFNADEAVDQYAEMVGVPPELVRSDEDVERLRRARAEEMARQQQKEEAREMVEGAKQLSETQTGNNSALDALLSGVGTEGGRNG